MSDWRDIEDARDTGRELERDEILEIVRATAAKITELNEGCLIYVQEIEAAILARS